MHAAALPNLSRPPRALVIGAGIGGLVSAAVLAHHGLSVELLERGPAPGGKLRQVMVGPQALDGGPTVLTMRWVFDQLFAQLGLDLAPLLPMRRCAVLARHAWGHDGPFDLLADLEASVAAISAFSGAAEGQRYRQFCDRARRIYDTLEQPFLRGQRPTPWSLAWRVGRQQGWQGLQQLARIAPFSSLWRALGAHFHDPRLRQLFGRYATYCGTSPFSAPATLMLVAHVERQAVWQVNGGGMQQLAQALATACRQQGVTLRCHRTVQEIVLRHGRVSGVLLADGERLDADLVVFNGDVNALAEGLLGQPLQRALGARPSAAADRSLSALTWHLTAETSGFELSHHNVFFSNPAHNGYRREFERLAQGQLPDDPTIYLCAQDRRAEVAGPALPLPLGTPERLMCLVNAPALAPGRRPPSNEELARCQDLMLAQLNQAGLRLQPGPLPLQRTTPTDFAQRFPATGGALYGPASRGWQASFRRLGAATPVPGLYLAGGSVHPGPGVPMAALSGQRAAEQICWDLRSTHRWRAAPMPGGTSMP